jgi:ABC-type transport system involved in cytochrome bd biosynthesis fused ATPase/permease subunit
VRTCSSFPWRRKARGHGRDTVLLAGASGTGKATILRAIGGQPEHVAVVAQDAHVFDGTIRDNLKLEGSHRSARRAHRYALARRCQGLRSPRRARDRLHGRQSVVLPGTPTARVELTGAESRDTLSRALMLQGVGEP